MGPYRALYTPPVPAAGHTPPWHAVPAPLAVRAVLLRSRHSPSSEILLQYFTPLRSELLFMYTFHLLKGAAELSSCLPVCDVVPGTQC